MSEAKFEHRLVPVDALVGGDNLRSAEGSLDELVLSIQTYGVLEPLLVAPDAGQKVGQFTVVAGSRRLAAARTAGLEQVPVVILDVAGVERLEVALIENLQREDLGPLEEGRAYERLIEAGRSTRQIAQRVGRGQSHIVKRLSLLELTPELQAALDSQGITVSQALEIAKLPAPLQGRIFESRFDSMTAAQAVQVIAREAAEGPNGHERPAAGPLASPARPKRVEASPSPPEPVESRVEALAGSAPAPSYTEVGEALRKVLSLGIPWALQEKAAVELFTAEETLAAGGRMQAWAAAVERASGVELTRILVAVAKVLP